MDLQKSLKYGITKKFEIWIYRKVWDMELQKSLRWIYKKVWDIITKSLRYGITTSLRYGITKKFEIWIYKKVWDMGLQQVWDME